MIDDAMGLWEYRIVIIRHPKRVSTLTVLVRYARYLAPSDTDKTHSFTAKYNGLTGGDIEAYCIRILRR